MKISAVYKITNTVTKDFYIGSSKDVKSRWTDHKKPSVWKKCPNNPLYQDMQKYGVDKFEFQILEEVEAEKLKETEQKFIETLKPAYNNRNANGLNIERKKEYLKEYEKSEKRKKAKKEYLKEYHKSDKFKEYLKEYHKSDKFKEYLKSDKFKEYQKEFYKEYNNQLCSYNGEVLTLCALSKRFQRAGIPHRQIEAKKYLLNKSKDNIKGE